MPHSTPLVESVAVGSIAAPIPAVQPMVSAESGRVGLFVRARGLLLDDGERLERFELIRPLRHEYMT